MRVYIRKTMPVLILAAGLFACGEKKQASHEIMICGDDKVWILNKNESDGTDVKVLWKWEYADVADQIPPEYKNYLRSMDECKFVDNNTKVLLASSSGGVLLIERATKECLFYAYAPMAHSVDLLPGKRIAVANSTHPKGNSIELYDLDKPEVVIWKDTLYSGHGSVWMNKRNRYYALGYQELREYSLKEWNTPTPSMQLERTWTIPDKGGHDLSPVSDYELLVSDHHGVSLFNIDTETFTSFAPLDAVENVKSVNFDKKTNALVYTKAEESWWTFNFYMTNPDKTIHVPGTKWYKVRTNPF